MAQLVFLVLVEEPHIKRTYGEFSDAPDRNDYAAATQGDNDGEDLTPHIGNHVYFFSFNRYDPNTWALLVGTLYVILLGLVPDSRGWAVAQVLVWRLIHWGGLGVVLWLQSERRVWTRHFTRRGRSLREAFAHWKALFNFSSTVNLVVFVTCAARFIPWSWSHMLTASYLSKVAIGLVLGGLSVWTSYSTYVSVGDFGWFYGDFFIGPEQYRNQLCYTGIYRFLNNPDAVTGYAGLYGLALVSESGIVFALAFLSQMMNMLFVNLVEIPHMKKLYDRKTMRDEGPLRRRVKTLIGNALPDMPDGVRERNEKLLGEMRKVRAKALLEVYQLYKKFGRDKETKKKQQLALNGESSSSTSSAGAVKTHVSAARTATLGQTLQVWFRTSETHADTDWIGIYPADMPSAPGLSDGRWVYVPPGATGIVDMPAHRLPRREGVYEVRYHPANSYEAVAAFPVIFAENKDDIPPLSPPHSPATPPASPPKSMSTSSMSDLEGEPDADAGADSVASRPRQRKK